MPQTPPRNLSPTNRNRGDSTASATGGAGSGLAGGRTGRHDVKHRLSLTFLKRASLSDGLRKGTNGTTGSIDARVATAAGASAPHNFRGNSNEGSGGALEGGRRSGQEDGVRENKPETRGSLANEMSLMGRMGSVKKRLSILGGSKRLKQRENAIPVEVVEESGEE